MVDAWITVARMVEEEESEEPMSTSLNTAPSFPVVGTNAIDFLPLFCIRDWKMLVTDD